MPMWNSRLGKGLLRSKLIYINNFTEMENKHLCSKDTQARIFELRWQHFVLLFKLKLLHQSITYFRGFNEMD
jgi:hypothetical protein